MIYVKMYEFDYWDSECNVEQCFHYQFTSACVSVYVIMIAVTKQP